MSIISIFSYLKSCLFIFMIFFLLCRNFLFIYSCTCWYLLLLPLFWRNVEKIITKTDVNKLQLSSVTQSCPALCNLMVCSTPGLPVYSQLWVFTQTHVHWVGDAIQPSHPLSSPFPPALDLCQHQGLFKCVSSSLQVAKVLEFHLQPQSFQWIFRIDFL